MLIRDCTEDDVAPLERSIPTRGTEAHRSHFKQQQAGGQTYLVALREHLPVGSCVLSWAGWLEPDLRGELPDCPEICNVHVAAEMRGQGIGTALIGEGERRVREAGYDRVGIGVAEDNVGAIRLYARLGYRDSGLRNESRYRYPDEDGVVQDVLEHDMALVKELV